MKELSAVQAVIAEDFYNIYGSGAQLYNAALKNQDIAKFIDNSRLQLENQLKADLIDPINKYLGQFKEIKERIAIQETRRIDVERYSRDMKSYTEKNNTAKLSSIEPKFEVAKNNYASLTDELMTDMPALYEDRILFFDPCFSTYLSGVAEYYRQSTKVTAEVIPLVAHVKRESIHNHQRVITPTEESAATHKVTAVSGSNVSSRSSFQNSSSIQSVEDDRKSSLPNSVPPSRPVPNPQKKTLKKAKCIFDFHAQESGELGFITGDILTIHTQNGEWWEAELNGKKGLIPSNYVEVIK